jgi:hypothetical protein
MKRFLAVILFFFLVVAPSVVMGGEVSVINIEGSAAMAEFETETMTKKAALENALRGSVEAAVKEVMKGEDILENAESIEDRIYPNPMNYILNYKILSEGWITHFDMPEDSVEPEGIEGEAMEGEGIDGEVLDGEPLEASGEEGEFSDDAEDIVDISMDADDDVVVLESEPVVEEVVVRRHRKGSLAESSFFTPTAEDIEQGVASGIGEGVLRGALLYHLKIETRVDIARLKEDVKAFSNIEEVETSVVSIEILGVSDHKRFEELKKGLEATAIIKELGYESFSRGRYVLSVSVAGTGHDLYDSLKGRLGKDLVLIPGGAGRVIIKFEERAF